MGRKYLDKKTKEESEEPKSRIERLSPNIDALDPMEVTYRNILIEKDSPGKELTKEELVKEEIRETGHQTRTTNQFQKYINAHLSERVSKIDKIKEAKQKWDNEVKQLQSNEPTSYSEINDQVASKLTSNSLEEMLKSLKISKDITSSKIKDFRNQIKQAEEELFQQEMNIQKIEKQIRKKKIEEQQKQVDSSKIKNDLANLTEKYDVDELKRILEVLGNKEKS